MGDGLGRPLDCGDKVVMHQGSPRHEKKGIVRGTDYVRALIEFEDGSRDWIVYGVLTRIPKTKRELAAAKRADARREREYAKRRARSDAARFADDDDGLGFGTF
jgi:hypothetical protein